jgi:hypothetical protein
MPTNQPESTYRTITALELIQRQRDEALYGAGWQAGNYLQTKLADWTEPEFPSTDLKGGKGRENR